MEALIYRVWDRRARRMLTYPDDGIIISRLPGHLHPIIYWFNTGSGGWDHVIEAEVNFATPFYDCHGRRIYENDIIRTVYGNGVVYMSRDTGQWMVRLDTDLPELFAMPREYIEIIGNVYEDPDLIRFDPGQDRTGKQP